MTFKVFGPNQTEHWQLKAVHERCSIYPCLLPNFIKREPRRQDDQLNDALRIRYFEKHGVWLTNQNAHELFEALSK